MSTKNIQLKGIILLISLWVSSTAFAQQTDSTLVAKVMLVQKINVDKKPIAVISVTFINTSNHDIYIPAILTKSTYPVGGMLKTYMKMNTKYLVL